MKGISCDHHVWNNAKNYSDLFVGCQGQNGWEAPVHVEAMVEREGCHFFAKDSMIHQGVNALVKSILSGRGVK